MKLEDLKKLCEAATPGPWVIDGLGIYGRQGVGEPLVGQVVIGQRPDALFTVAAREYMPKLIKVAEAAKCEYPEADMKTVYIRGVKVETWDHKATKNCGYCDTCMAKIELEKK